MDEVIINDYLKGVGSNPRGEPLFRLVWSTTQRELRYGTYNEFYHDLFVRTVTGVREVPKYPFLVDRWVLEMWRPPEMVICEELPESKNGLYEPLYVFEDGDRNPLPLNLKVVEIIVKTMLGRHRKASYIEKDIATDLKERDEKDIERDVEFLM